MREDLKPLLESYLQTLRTVRRAKRRATREVDREILAGMEEDLEWTVEYLASGFIPPFPTSRKVIPVDPERLSVYLARRRVPPLLPAEEVRLRVLQALDALTEREREAILLVRGEGCTFREAAEIMGISRGSVQKFVERATSKLRQKLAGHR